jgi:holliday junction DNA helicase RuvA
MIGHIAGKLLVKGAEFIIVEAQGIGYELTCPLTVLERLPLEGEMCTLAVKTHVREDQITLFGFSSFDERRLFGHLTSVSGIGPRLAVACLSGMNADHMKAAIMDGNTKKLSSIPGIGKKTAERMVLELRSKFEKAYVLQAAQPQSSSILNDLQSALINLGYKSKEIQKYVDTIKDQANTMTFEELLKGALSHFTF